MTMRLLGIYIEISNATSLADVRVCLVEQGFGDRAIMRAVGQEDQGKVAAVFTAIPPETLMQMVDAIHGKEEDKLSA